LEIWEGSPQTRLLVFNPRVGFIWGYIHQEFGHPTAWRAAVLDNLEGVL
jgi:hypothetical protein